MFDLKWKISKKQIENLDSQKVLQNTCFMGVRIKAAQVNEPIVRLNPTF